VPNGTTILIPSCKVTVAIDGTAPVSVGHANPKEALEAYIDARHLQTLSLSGKPAIKVEQRSVDGLTIAYAVRWSDYFNDWTMMAADRSDEYPIPSTCVEGITVDFASPGQKTRGLLVCTAAVLSAAGSNTREDTTDRIAQHIRRTAMEVGGEDFDDLLDEVIAATEESPFHFFSTQAWSNRIMMSPYDY
jgi:hypothetical protein